MISARGQKNVPDKEEYFAYSGFHKPNHRRYGSVEVAE
jgi:hypothetical protein